jgi:hypothetical protein
MTKEDDLYQAIYEAMMNSYNVIVKKKDPYEMLQKREDTVTFAHHVDNPINTKSLDQMIAWWEEEEEYEMCGELLRIKNGIKRLSKRNCNQVH